MKPTFQLHYKSPTLLSVGCFDQEILTFREGLYEPAVEFINPHSELNEPAVDWLSRNFIQLMFCNINARLHLFNSLSQQWHWEALILSVRHGFVNLDKKIFPHGKASIAMIERHPDAIRQSYIDSVNALGIEDAEELGIEDFDAIELIDKITEFDDDMIVELTRTLLQSFSEYCSLEFSENNSMPDDAFAHIVLDTFLHDFLWWPMYANKYPRYIVGNTIMYARMKKGWTEEQLAEAVGIRESNVRSIESGRYDAKIDIVFRIAAALGINIEFVIDRQ